MSYQQKLRRKKKYWLISKNSRNQQIHRRGQRTNQKMMKKICGVIFQWIGSKYFVYGSELVWFLLSSSSILWLDVFLQRSCAAEHLTSSFHLKGIYSYVAYLEQSQPGGAHPSPVCAKIDVSTLEGLFRSWAHGHWNFCLLISIKEATFSVMPCHHFHGYNASSSDPCADLACNQLKLATNSVELTTGWEPWDYCTFL